MLLIALALVQAPAPTPETRVAIGIWERWGAFRSEAPRRCYAIAAPLRTRRARQRGAFASVTAQVGTPPRPAFFARLRTARRGIATLAVGDRRFTLVGNGTDVWAADTATDRALISAMRGARVMSIAAVSLRGTPFADVYALPGAATAIDAATLACLAR